MYYPLESDFVAIVFEDKMADGWRRELKAFEDDQRETKLR